jgi:hypothetical protein
MPGSFMNCTAATVSGELIATFSFSSCSSPPYDHISDRPTMSESISWDIPIPSWMPWSLLIFEPPSSSSSQVEGPSGKPALSHMLMR